MSSDSGNMLVKYLAVGRLVKSDGQYKEGKHIIIVEYTGNKKDKDQINYRNHITAIMNKGAQKLQHSKRIKLTSDNADYEVHALTDILNEDTNHKIVFFAVTDIDFAKNFTVAKLLQDFKDAFYMNCSPSEIASANSNGLQRQMDKTLSAIIQKYGSSKLASVNAKVGEVKSLLQEGVKKALYNAEQIDEIEIKSVELEKEGRIFDKQATDVKRQQCCSYYKMNCLICLGVCGVLAVVAVPIALKAKGDI